jgi:hypothetical protein
MMPVVVFVRPVKVPSGGNIRKMSEDRNSGLNLQSRVTVDNAAASTSTAMNAARTILEGRNIFSNEEGCA